MPGLNRRSRKSWGRLAAPLAVGILLAVGWAPYFGTQTGAGAPLAAVATPTGNSDATRVPTGGNQARDTPSPLATVPIEQDPSGIPVGGEPLAITLDSSNGDLYVADSSTNNVSVIDGSSNTVATSITVGNYPDGIDYDAADGDVYVANYGSANVSVISGSSNKVLTSLSGMEDPAGVTYDDEDGDIYVAGHSNVTILNGTTVVAVVGVGTSSELSGIAYDPSNNWVYVTDGGAGDVYVLSGTSLVATVNADLSGPDCAMFDPGVGDVLIGGEQGVSEIGGTSLIATISLAWNTIDRPAEYVESLGYDPVTGYAFVATTTPDEISVINGSTPIGAPFTDLHSYPTAIVFDPSDNDLYVTAAQGWAVWVLNGSAYYPSISSFVGTPSSIELGSTIPTITLTVQALPGEGPISYSYSGLPSSCVSADTSSLACTPEAAGSYLVVVRVNDSLGNSVQTAMGFDVVDPVTVTATAVQDPTDAGAGVAFEAIPSQGLAPYSYAWSFGDGGSSTAKDPTHAYAATGGYVATVWVNDSGGGSAKTTLSITVDPELISVVTLSNATLALGQTFSLTNSVSGGVAPYTYFYQSLPPGCVSVDSPTIGCLPTQSGNYTIEAFVRDANNVLVGVNTTLLVDFEFTVVAPSRSPVEQPLTVRVTPEGGYGTITYTYAGLPSGCAPADAPTITCTPNRTGDYEISITIEDAVGNRGNRVVTVDIVPARATGLPAALTSPLVLEGAGVAFATVLIIALVLFAARGSRQGSSSAAYAAYRRSPSQRSPSESNSVEFDPGVPREDRKNPGAEDPLSDLV